MVQAINPPGQLCSGCLGLVSKPLVGEDSDYSNAARSTGLGKVSDQQWTISGGIAQSEGTFGGMCFLKDIKTIKLTRAWYA